VHGQHQDRQDPDPERGRRLPEDRKQARDSVDDLAAPISGVEAEGQPDHEGDQQCGAAELERRRDPVGDHLRHRQLALERRAEVALQKVAEVGHVLHDQRSVETDRSPDLVIHLT
jgi:hypothetical protein